MEKFPCNPVQIDLFLSMLPCHARFKIRGLNHIEEKTSVNCAFSCSKYIFCISFSNKSKGSKEGLGTSEA
jgi:hypothetical protein